MDNPSVDHSSPLPENWNKIEGEKDFENNFIPKQQLKEDLEGLNRAMQAVFSRKVKTEKVFKKGAMRLNGTYNQAMRHAQDGFNIALEDIKNKYNL